MTLLFAGADRAALSYGRMTSDSVLLASIHDVSPRFEGEVDQLLGLMHPFVGSRLAMLVVPDHWGDAPIIAGSPFATRLRSWAESGVELFLHGYYHRDDARHSGSIARFKSRHLTAGEGEFLGLDRTEAARRIDAGRDVIEQISGRPIAGFVAPAWLYGAGAIAALRKCGIGLAEDHWRVWSPQTGRPLARGPVITWASRTPLRLSSSLAAARVLRRLPMRTMRVGAHPPDIGHPAIVRSIEDTLRIATRNRHVARYAELKTSS